MPTPKLINPALTVTELNSMRIRFIKFCLVSFLAFNLIGCIVNPTPNSDSYTMTDAEIKAVQYNALQTQNADREARKAMLRDEAEIRAWEKNISSHNAVIVAPSRY